MSQGHDVSNQPRDWHGRFGEFFFPTQPPTGPHKLKPVKRGKASKRRKGGRVQRIRHRVWVIFHPYENWKRKRIARYKREAKGSLHRL